MAVKVVLTNKSQQINQLAKTGTIPDDKLRVSRAVYQEFRSLTKNRVITESYNNGLLPKEFMNILDEFNNIQQGKTVTENIKKLDEYLGELGIDAVYYYSKDIINIAPWVTESAQYGFRNVIDRLTSYNVIDRVTGYNVIHKTKLQG